ncbi:MAG: alkaline phosphatase family protein [Myxococcales bacterium]|nr:alkaline phosphatase family protein [Myxococcales bacterium]
MRWLSRWIAWLPLLAVGATAESPVADPAAAAPDAPRLVVVLAIDQLRADRLTEQSQAGLGRLVREGRVYENAALEHALTETCPGHVTMSTGRHPAAAGIPANTLVEEAAGEARYCVDDPSEDAAVLGNPAFGRSPRTLRVEALGDWLKRAHPESKVYSVAGKDRAAITLGGQQPDGAYWYDRHVTPRFTTSRYYASELPAWITEWNGSDPPNDGFLSELPEQWTHGSISDPYRIDDFDGENDRLERVSGHPLVSGDLAEIGDQLYASPHLDELTLQFAQELALREDLGTDDVPDLLAVSLSGHDVVGHLYGPYSHESQDTLRRIDEGLAGFLEFLEARTGGRLVIALTSDHGVLPLPEFRAPEGEPPCPEPGGRVGIRWMIAKVLIGLHFELSPFSWPRWWLVVGGSQLGIRRELAESRGVDIDEAIAAAERRLEAVPAIKEIWTRKEIETREGDLAELYRHSFVPGRSGDLLVEGAPGCLIWPFDAGSTHGSPHGYDRRVPLVFFGNGIAPARVSGPASTLDIAPTLAALLGITPPEGLDGRVLLGGPDPAPTR